MAAPLVAGFDSPQEPGWSEPEVPQVPDMGMCQEPTWEPDDSAVHRIVTVIIHFKNGSIGKISSKMISNIFFMFTLKVLRVLFALAVNFALDEADGRHFSSIDLLQMISKLQ